MMLVEGAGMDGRAGALHAHADYIGLYALPNALLTEPSRS